MSIHVTSYIWKEYRGTVAQKLLMLKLADNCNDEGFCYPSISRIATECGMSERYVQKTLKAIEKRGDLRIDRNAGIETPNGRTNAYYLENYRANKSAISVTTKPANGVNNSTPLLTEGVNNSTPQGVNNSTPKPSLEPSLNTTTPPATPEPVGSEEQKTLETKPTEPSVKLSKDQFDGFMEVLNKHFKAYRNYAMDIFHVIRGTATGRYKKYAMTDKPVELSELKAYVAWYEREYPKLTLPGITKLPSSIEAYRQTAVTRTAPRPVNDDPYGLNAILKGDAA